MLAYRPAAHVRHNVDVSLLVYVPALQARHAVLFVVGLYVVEYVPLPHAMHLEFCVFTQLVCKNCPGIHVWHVLHVLEPVVLAYDESGH